jgi:uncharacterized protein YodC (DUF2158 family)
MVRGYQTMVTDIAIENEILCAWYQKYGFVQESTERSDFVSHMTKSLLSGD